MDIGRDLTRDRALRSSVMAMGTNHNYYNTEWTPGLSQSPAWDDWFDSGDSQCGENGDQRLSPEEQQAVGLAYTAALVDLAVGGSSRSLPLLEARASSRPRSAGRMPSSTPWAATSDCCTPRAGARRCRRRDSRRGLPRLFSGGAVRPPSRMRTGQFVRADPALVADVLRRNGPGAARARGRVAAGRREPRHTGQAQEAVPTRSIFASPASRRSARRVRCARARCVGRWVALGAGPRHLGSYVGEARSGSRRAAGARGPPVRRRGLARRRGCRASPRRRTDASGCSTSRRASRACWQRRHRLAAGQRFGRVVVEGDAGDFTVNLPIVIDGEVTRPARLWVQLTDYADSSSRRVASGSSSRRARLGNGAV